VLLTDRGAAAAYGSDGLSLTTALRRNAASLSTALLECATASFFGEAATLTAGSAWRTGATSASTHVSTASVESRVAAAKGIWSWSAFFDVDLLRADLVRVCVDGGIVASWCSEFNESAILETWSAYDPSIGKTLPTLGRETSKYFISPNFSSVLLSLLASIFSVTFLM
jgi:hypothetical protein